MSRAAQAPVFRFFAGFRARRANAALIVCAMLALSACSMSKGGIDTSLLTSDIPAPSGDAADAGRLSDEATIRNAVSSADLQELGGQAIAWANADTGARGSITGISESKDRAGLCRRFTTTRENFDGVRLFKGEICMVSAGAWRLDQFAAL